MAAFATAAELSAWTGGKIAEDDPRSEDLLNALSLYVRRHCGWHIGPTQEDSIVLDGIDSKFLYLPSLNVTEVDSIEVDGDVVDSADYEWSALGMVKRSAYPYSWCGSYRSIQITFTHGFDNFEDVRQVVLQAAARALASPMGYKTEQAGSVSVTLSSAGSAFSVDELNILGNYRLPRRP